MSGGTNLYWAPPRCPSATMFLTRSLPQRDLIVAIGHDPIEKPPFIMGPSGPKVIHVSYTPASVELV